MEAELKAVAKELKHKLYVCCITDGMVDRAAGNVTDSHDAVYTLAAISGLPENSVVFLGNYHLFFEEANPVLVA